MEQDSAVLRTAAPSTGHVLRALLLFPALLTGWWLLSTGAAHADDAHAASGRDEPVADSATVDGGQLTDQLRHTTHAALTTSMGAGRHSARRVGADVRRTAATASAQQGTVPGVSSVDHSVDSAGSPVRQVDRTVAGSVADAGRTVHQATRHIVAAVEPVLAGLGVPPPKSPAPARVTRVAAAVPAHVAVLRPMPRRVQAAAPRVGSPPTVAADAWSASSTSVADAAAHSGTAHPGVVMTRGVDAPWPATPSTPAPAVPAPTTSSFVSAAALLGLLVLLLPLVRRFRFRLDAFTLPLAPVYPPGCSPD